jgi:hypothetical protein
MLLVALIGGSFRSGTEEGASEHDRPLVKSYGSGVALKRNLRCPQVGAGVGALVPAAWLLAGSRSEQNLLATATVVLAGPRQALAVAPSVWAGSRQADARRGIRCA